MKITLADFRGQDRFSADRKIRASELDLDTQVMRITSDLSVHLEAQLDAGEMTVLATLRGECVYTCSRCLAEFNNLFEKEATLYYDMRDSNSVVIDPELRDELLVDHPIQILCREDCRGLCDVCGANLNAGPCKCGQKSES